MTSDSRLDQAVLSRLVAAEAACDPGRVVCVFEAEHHPAEPVTAGGLAQAGDAVAAAFAGAGLEPGDRVAVMLGNHPELLSTLVANARLGLATVPVDPRGRAGELAATLALTGPSALVIADTLAAVHSIADIAAASGTAVWVASTPEGRAAGAEPPSAWPTLNDVSTQETAPPVAEHVVSLDEPWLGLATTVTVGGVPYRGVIQVTWGRMSSYREVPGLVGYRENDVPYTALPLAHGDAFALTVLPALTGAVDHAVIGRSFAKRRLWQLCAEHGVTAWATTGADATAVYSLPSGDHDRAHGVHLVVAAGLPAGIRRAFEERYQVSVVDWSGGVAGVADLSTRPLVAGIDLVTAHDDDRLSPVA